MIVALFTKEIFRMVSNNSEASILMHLVINMTESGRIIKNKVKASILMHLVINMTESGRMV